MTAGAIAGLFAHAWPTTTRHLQTLERAGLVSQSRAGRSRCYRLNRERLALAGGWLGWFGDNIEVGDLEAAHRFYGELLRSEGRPADASTSRPGR